MNEFQILFTVMAAGFGLVLSLMLVIWNRVDKVDQKIDGVNQSLNGKLDGLRTELKQEISRLAEKTEDIDRRLCRIEGSLSNHGHCLFTKSQSDQKAL